MLLYTFGFVLLACGSLARDLPYYFPKCNLDDNNLNKCLLEATKLLKPRLLKGIKELNLPKFDPLVIDFSATQESRMVNYNISFVNFTVRGFDSYEFDKFTYDPNTLEFNGILRLKNVEISFLYKVNGQLLNIPLRGEGSGEASYGLLKGSFQIKGDMIKRNNIEYYRPLDTNVHLKITGATSYFKGLFGGNDELAQVTNELLNTHGQEVVDAYTPALEKLTERILMKVVRTLTKLVPYRKIFSHS